VARFAVLLDYPELESIPDKEDSVSRSDRCEAGSAVRRTYGDGARFGSIAAPQLIEIVCISADEEKRLSYMDEGARIGAAVDERAIGYEVSELVGSFRRPVGAPRLGTGPPAGK